jgi:DNA-binding transcriptional ArsR family regulator
MSVKQLFFGVRPMAKQEEKKGWPAADAKWTQKSGQYGYTVIPNILFWYTADLGITPPQQALLFQLLSRWWVGEGTPPISKAWLAEGLGTSERQVQRHLSALKKAGLIEARFPNKPGRHPYQYTFEGLVNKLQNIAVAYGGKKRQKKHRRDEAVRSASKELEGQSV